ncbi:MAG: deoxyribodipyrimidine photo-lyase [Nitrospira sp.]|nr:deoxyribodipyrimidine photo-lyase [Nitrospira sp.]
MASRFSGDKGSQIEQVVQAAREWKADAVYWNRDYEPRAIERDHLVQQQLGKVGTCQDVQRSCGL